MIKEYRIRPMDESSVREIVCWKYPEPYSIYDLGEDATEELTGGDYYAVFSGTGELAGFFCFGSPAQVPPGREYGYYDGSALDIGLGLKPELCGIGIGAGFLEKGLCFAEERFNTGSFRLTVASFNKRAVKVYETAGFRKTGSFLVDKISATTEFIVMNLERRGAALG